MSSSTRSFAARLAPGWLRSARRRLLAYRQFSGHYATWAEAALASSGYDGPEIVERVLRATREVSTQPGCFERDGVVFAAEPGEPDLCACLMEAARVRGRLNVLDVGGSLGTTFWRHGRALTGVPVTWAIVEQPRFVAAGRESLRDTPLRFFDSVEQATDAAEFDLLLASTSTQYLEDPHAAVAAWRHLAIPYLLFNNLPLTEAAQDRLVVQRVPRSIYRASYPVWLFSRTQFLNEMSDGYALVRSFASEAVWQVGWNDLRSTGLFYRRKSP